MGKRTGGPGSRSGSVSYRYIPYEFEGKRLRIPAASVVLRNPSLQDAATETFETFALIDSGATTSFLPLEMAKGLGLALGDEGEARGAGGRFKTWLVEAEVALIKGRKVYDSATGPFLIPQEADAIPYAILGRDWLFKRFRITFDERQHMLTLRRY